MKVLVCGGRKFSYVEDRNLTAQERDIREQQRDLLRAFLSTWHSVKPMSLLIHGDANGTDKSSGMWARDTGVQEVRCPANWDHFGKRAGYERNSAMLLLEPEVVIAFPGGTGTANMMTLAANRRIRVVTANVLT